MIGEATHGSYDYYRLREQLTRRLDRRAGFSFVAVEGDWPDCDRVHRSVTAAPGGARRSAARPGTVRALADLDVGERRGGPLLPLAAGVEPGAAGGAAGRLPRAGRVQPLGVDAGDLRLPGRGGPDRRWRRRRRRTAASSRTAGGSRSTRRPAGSSPPGARRRWSGCWRVPANTPLSDGPDRFSAWQNAEVVAGAERYYRAMVAGGPESWNVRDTHMADTLDRLLDRYGPERAGHRLGAQHARRRRPGHRHGGRRDGQHRSARPGNGTAATRWR